jgi:hypothetical protein
MVERDSIIVDLFIKAGEKFDKNRNGCSTHTHSPAVPTD